MSHSGGGPHMYNMGSKEKNSPMNFSDKAMKYMKNMPAMYGKPKMDGDPVKKKSNNSSNRLGHVDGLPDSNEERVKLLDSYRKDNPGARAEVGALITYAADKKKKQQAKRIRDNKSYANSEMGGLAKYLGKSKLSVADYKKYIDPKTKKVKASQFQFKNKAEAKKFFETIGRTKKK